MNKNLPEGTIVKTAIQCIYPQTGKTGSFFYTGEYHADDSAVCSPLFSDLIGLFTWAHSNGFKCCYEGHIYHKPNG